MKLSQKECENKSFQEILNLYNISAQEYKI